MLLRDGLRLRSGPDFSFPEVALLPLDTELLVLGESIMANDGTRWWKVQVPSYGIGYVAEYRLDSCGRILERSIKPKIELGDRVVVANPCYDGIVNLRTQEREDYCRDIGTIDEAGRVVSEAELVEEVLSRGRELVVIGGPEPRCDERLNPQAAREGRKWWLVETVDTHVRGYTADFGSKSRNMYIAPSWYLQSAQQQSRTCPSSCFE